MFLAFTLYTTTISKNQNLPRIKNAINILTNMQTHNKLADIKTDSKSFWFRPSALSLSCHSWARILLCKKKGLFG